MFGMSLAELFPVKIELPRRSKWAETRFRNLQRKETEIGLIDRERKLFNRLKSKGENVERLPAQKVA
jgi:hypothetical protein